MPSFRVPRPDLQIDFFERLEVLRNEILLDALLKTLRTSNLSKIDDELRATVPRKQLQKMAGIGLRGELAFAVPYLLGRNPGLLGYYRLLLGFSQKQFYGRECGFGLFSAMEKKGELGKRQAPLLPDLCLAINEGSALLIQALPRFSTDVIRELTLLTVGPQLRGGRNVRLGQKGNKDVFDAVKRIVRKAIVREEDGLLELQNAAGRQVVIRFASDPDVRIQEAMKSGRMRNVVALEIKGGTDFSNVHNRVGEAEKSHQKAKGKGYTECWTILRVKGFDISTVTEESPTTDRFFDIDEISKPDSEQAVEFRERLTGLVGIEEDSA